VTQAHIDAQAISHNGRDAVPVPWRQVQQRAGDEIEAFGACEALWHGAGGRLECRPEKQARQCNERSLLRRYGAGVKVLTMMREETYTEYREEMVEGAASTGMIMMDGGVGGRVF
jgi:hypothetical protein